MFCFVVLFHRQILALFYYFTSFPELCFPILNKMLQSWSFSLCTLPSISSVSEYLLCIVVSLCACMPSFFKTPIVAFICPSGLITSPNILIDAFISHSPLKRYLLSVCTHAKHPAISANHSSCASVIYSRE